MYGNSLLVALLVVAGVEAARLKRGGVAYRDSKIEKSSSERMPDDCMKKIMEKEKACENKCPDGSAEDCMDNCMGPPPSGCNNQQKQKYMCEQECRGDDDCIKACMGAKPEPEPEAEPEPKPEDGEGSEGDADEKEKHFLECKGMCDRTLVSGMITEETNKCMDECMFMERKKRGCEQQCGEGSTEDCMDKCMGPKPENGGGSGSGISGSGTSGSGSASGSGTWDSGSAEGTGDDVLASGSG